MRNFIVFDVLKKYEENGYFKVKILYCLVGGGVLKEKTFSCKNKYHIDNIKRGHYFESDD